MIEAGLEFPSPSRRLVVQTFLDLPKRLRPHSTKIGENEVGTIIQERNKFLNETIVQGTGFFLNGTGVTYDINIARSKSIVCNCFLDVDPDLIKEFLIHMASARPVFGFSCTNEERERWNRIKVQQGINSIDSWVGRDPQKYVPGLYWWTVLPTALAKNMMCRSRRLGGSPWSTSRSKAGKISFDFTINRMAGGPRRVSMSCVRRSPEYSMSKR